MKVLFAQDRSGEKEKVLKLSFQDFGASSGAWARDATIKSYGQTATKSFFQLQRFSGHEGCVPISALFSPVRSISFCRMDAGNIHPAFRFPSFFPQRHVLCLSAPV